MSSLPNLLIESVKYNCDLSDAEHAGDYSLCVYLMHMREYFRWEQNLPYDAKLDAGTVGEWVSAREQYWDTLEGQSYRKIPLPTGEVDAFDIEQINSWLVPQGYGYSAGIGRFDKPVFSLGRLTTFEQGDGYELFYTGEEVVRELIAPPAMTRGATIWIRQEALRRVLWEMIEEWRWKKPKNAMARTLAGYGFGQDPETALDRMAEQFSEFAILHELGEKICGECLGDDWNQMVMAASDRAQEILIRAVRDLLADCMMVLPALLSQEEKSPLHFYFATMAGIRRQLFPSLFNAYQRWVDAGDFQPLRKIVRKGGHHWRHQAAGLLERHRVSGEPRNGVFEGCSIEALAL